MSENNVKRAGEDDTLDNSTNELEEGNNAEKALKEESVEKKEDIADLNIHKTIEGHNNNTSANEEFRREEAAKYSEERLTEDDYAVAERVKKEVPSHDYSSVTQKLMKISAIDALKARDELIDIIKELIFECINRGGECNKTTETVDKINEVIHSMTDELEWN